MGYRRRRLLTSRLAAPAQTGKPSGEPVPEPISPDGPRLVKRFASTGELLDFARNRKPASSSPEHSRQTSRYDFTRTADFSEAYKLATEGWPEGLERVKMIAEAMI